jgi:hypothetical protein
MPKCGAYLSLNLFLFDAACTPEPDCDSVAEIRVPATAVTAPVTIVVARKSLRFIVTFPSLVMEALKFKRNFNSASCPACRRGQDSNFLVSSPPLMLSSSRANAIQKELFDMRRLLALGAKS